MQTSLFSSPSAASLSRKFVFWILFFFFFNEFELFLQLPSGICAMQKLLVFGMRKTFCGSVLMVTEGLVVFGFVVCWFLMEPTGLISNSV